MSPNAPLGPFKLFLGELKYFLEKEEEKNNLDERILVLVRTNWKYNENSVVYDDNTKMHYLG